MNLSDGAGASHPAMGLTNVELWLQFLNIAKLVTESSSLEMVWAILRGTHSCDPLDYDSNYYLVVMRRDSM